MRLTAALSHPDPIAALGIQKLAVTHRSKGYTSVLESRLIFQKKTCMVMIAEACICSIMIYDADTAVCSLWLLQCRCAGDEGAMWSCMRETADERPVRCLPGTSCSSFTKMVTSHFPILRHYEIAFGEEDEG